MVMKTDNPFINFWLNYKTMESELVSTCCGAQPISNGDNDSVDYGICPECGEYCEYIEEEEE
jgi:hypothetical protein